MVDMMTEALRCLKAGKAVLLNTPMILALCREAVYQGRSCLLGSVTSVHLCIL